MTSEETNLISLVAIIVKRLIFLVKIPLTYDHLFYHFIRLPVVYVLRKVFDFLSPIINKCVWRFSIPMCFYYLTYRLQKILKYKIFVILVYHHISFFWSLLWPLSICFITHSVCFSIQDFFILFPHFHSFSCFFCVKLFKRKKYA